jgi:hypothetical protein
LDLTLERLLESIDRPSELGFKMYSLEVLEPPPVSGKGEHPASAEQRSGVSFSSFIPYHCVTNLTSAKEEGRQLGVKQFGEGVEIAKNLEVLCPPLGATSTPCLIFKSSEGFLARNVSVFLSIRTCV